MGKTETGERKRRLGVGGFSLFPTDPAKPVSSFKTVIIAYLLFILELNKSMTFQ